MLETLGAMPTFVAGVLGSLLAGLGTGVGALFIFVRQRWDERAQVIMLAVAAGVMLGATVFSLIVPALDTASSNGHGELWAALLVSAGICLGAVSIWGIHAVLPHQHFNKGHEGGSSFALGRNWLFILAITLHNFPEGMSVGVAFGNDVGTGVAVMLGMALQNLPEGLAVAAALISDGFGRGHAFRLALLTGLVEPIGGLVGAAAVSSSHALLPWGLAFAGGAMLFVISGEVIPETHGKGNERTATFCLVLGFVVMMLLDVTLG